jgi:hypothetical protein
LIFFDLYKCSPAVGPMDMSVRTDRQNALMPTL